MAPPQTMVLRAVLVVACGLSSALAFAPSVGLRSASLSPSLAVQQRAAGSLGGALGTGRGAAGRTVGRGGGIGGLRMGEFVQTVNAEELEVAIQDSSVPLVVDFYTDWCGPCRLIAPQLEKVAEEYGDKVKFVKIDTDEYDEIASQLRVYALPTLCFFKDAEALGRVEGAMMAPKIKSVVEFNFFGGEMPDDIDTMYIKEEDTK